jgi:hypothetical protein
MDPLVERSLAAASGSTPHVSFFGEVAPILCGRGDIDGMQRLEQIAHEFAATRPMSILCGYSTTLFEDGPDGPTRLASVAAAHSTFVPSGS